MKPIGCLFVGFPLGALWMGLWMWAHVQRAAKQLKEATEYYHRAQAILARNDETLRRLEELFRKVRDFIKTPEQMTMTIVGLNAPVWVKQKGKFERFQLWELMQRYGNVMNIGAPAPFDDNAVYLTEPRP